MTRVSKKCSCLEFFGEDPECVQHGRKSNWAHQHPDISNYIVRYEGAQEKLDEAVAILRWIWDHYPDPNIGHQDFRVQAAGRAHALVSRIDSEADLLAEIERASQSHAPDVPGEIATDEDA
jgi:hypothetical protein